MSVKSKCAFCDSLSTKNCGACKSISYCSKECQEKDWFKNHKFICSTTPFPSRTPSSNSVYGILFAEDGTIKFVNVELKRSTQMLIDPKQMAPNLIPYLNATEETNILPRKPFEEKNLENSLKFIFRDNFFNDGSKPNLAIKKLTQNKNPHDWRGPMLVLKVKGILTSNYELHTYMDMEMKDVQDANDYFMWYGSSQSKKLAAENQENIARMFPGAQFFSLN